MLGKWFKKRQPELQSIDLALFKVDMHSHLIPGIDDGSPNMDSTIAMLAKFESLGYTKIVTTPHIMSDYYRNTPEIISSGLEEVKHTAEQLGLKISIEAAAEYYFDDYLMGLVKSKQPLLTFGDNYVLVEFSFHSEPAQIEELFFELLTQGYKPVLAHFERYTYYLGSIEKAKEWRAKGVNIQMNLNSLTGHYGPGIKEQAERLVDEGQLDFVASDCHRIEHLLMMEKARNLPHYHKLLTLPLKNTQL